jgi:hypothetical protein
MITGGNITVKRSCQRVDAAFVESLETQDTTKKTSF